MTFTCQFRLQIIQRFFGHKKHELYRLVFLLVRMYILFKLNNIVGVLEFKHFYIIHHQIVQ